MRHDLTLCLFIALVAPTFAHAVDDEKIRAAQVATLAELAPLICPGLTTAEEAVTEYLDRSRISAQDLDGSYQSSMGDVAASLASSVSRDKNAACTQLWQQLGRDGLGLVTGQSVVR